MYNICTYVLWGDGLYRALQGYPNFAAPKFACAIFLFMIVFGFLV